MIARGGGSVEDLLPFSDEGLVRAVFAARTPVVSAIGARAGQPAARPGGRRPRVHPDRRRQARRPRRRRGDRCASSTCATAAAQLVTAWLAREQHALDTVRARPALADPGSGLSARAVEVDALRDRARRTLHHQLDRAANDLGHQLARVRGMSPLATLQRGYAVLQDADGHVVTSVEQATTGRALQVRVVDGRIAVTVTGTETTELTAPSKETS